MCVARMTITWSEGEWKGKGRGQGRTDVSHSRRDANLDTRVSFLCQLTLEELVQFGVENTICHELPTLGNRGPWYRSHDCGAVGKLRLTEDAVVEVYRNC